METKCPILNTFVKMIERDVTLSKLCEVHQAVRQLHGFTNTEYGTKGLEGKQLK